MWLRCVCGLSLRAAMSSIIRWRSGLTVLVSLMGSSILSEVDEHLDSQDGALHPLLASFRLVKGLSALAPAQRAGAQRLCALALRDKPDLLYRILFTSAFRVLRKNGPTIVTIVAD